MYDTKSPKEYVSSSPRVEACIAECMARHKGHSHSAQAAYFEDVHQDLAPLARQLEIENVELRAALRFKGKK